MEENIRGDKEIRLENTYVSLPEIFYFKQEPEKAPKPELVIFNDRLAEELGLDGEFLKSEEGVEILCGNKLVENTTPISEAYAGHQFGYFTMLGDGRAVLLGELTSKDGNKFDIQLKGSGRTPYSRGGDGKAPLGPMLREYIISEGMYGLGIKTTRSLAVVKTGEEIYRDKALEGSVLVRVAKSHIRVATFQFASEFGTVDDVRAIADYTIKRHYREALKEENPYRYLLKAVCKSQAELISKWQLVGFIHGVMNTDNMSICGETIDYGPCAFMDYYSKDTVFSSIDKMGRYAYGNQPKIGAWNLARFAETLLPLLDEEGEKSVQIAREAIENYYDMYRRLWYSGMRRKLGIFNEEEEDIELIEELLKIMERSGADFTNTFVQLTLGNVENTDLYEKEDFKNWYSKWLKRVRSQGISEEDIRKSMKACNPIVIPRNHRVEEAIDAAVKNNDYSVMNSLLNAIRRPYDYDNVDEYYTTDVELSTSKYRTYCGT